MKKIIFSILIISLLTIIVGCSNTTNTTNADDNTVITDNTNYFQETETIDSMIEKIDWLRADGQYGSACLRINGNKVIYTDPAKISEEQTKIKADIILITHSHPDHISLETIEKISKDSTVIITEKNCYDMIMDEYPEYNVKVVLPGDSLNVYGMELKAVPAYGSREHKKSYNWLGFVISIYGLNIYISGSTDVIEEMNDIKDIDIAFLYVLPPWSLGPEKAVQVAEIIKPKVLIPIHWTENIKDDIDYIINNIPDYTKVVLLDLMN